MDIRTLSSQASSSSGHLWAYCHTNELIRGEIYIWTSMDIALLMKAVSATCVS